MKTYEICGKAVADRVAAMVRKFHPDLKKIEAKIDLLFVATDADGPALTLHGYACAAVVRIIGKRDRAAGRGDAEIIFDREGYEDMTDAQRDALIDHELYHLLPAKDKNQKFKSDDQGRPVLKMRKHDREYGWFDEIARRHGDNSCEIRQARALVATSGQLYFHFGRSEKLAEVA